MKVKTKLPVPSIAASGRWIKGADGEWGFDFDIPSEDGAKTKASDDDDDDDDDNGVTYTEKINHKQQQPNLGDIAKNLSSQDNSSNGQAIHSQSSNQTQQTVSSQSQPQNITSINLVLRMRDEKKELQDIKFEFLPNKDTVDEISSELVNAKLIDAIDMISVSANLNKLLQNYSLSPITFPLVI